VCEEAGSYASTHACTHRHRHRATDKDTHTRTARKHSRALACRLTLTHRDKRNRRIHAKDDAHLAVAGGCKSHNTQANITCIACQAASACAYDSGLNGIISSVAGLAEAGRSGASGCGGDPNTTREVGSSSVNPRPDFGRRISEGRCNHNHISIINACICMYVQRKNKFTQATRKHS
jgi:hypothetical protein